MNRILTSGLVLVALLASSSTGAFAQPAPDMNRLVEAAQTSKGCTIKSEVDGLTDFDALSTVLQSLAAALPAAANARVSFDPPTNGGSAQTMYITFYSNGQYLYSAVKDFKSHHSSASCTDYESK